MTPTEEQTTLLLMTELRKFMFKNQVSEIFIRGDKLDFTRNIWAENESVEDVIELILEELEELNLQQYSGSHYFYSNNHCEIDIFDVLAYFGIKS